MEYVNALPKVMGFLEVLRIHYANRMCLYKKFMTPINSDFESG